MTHRVALAGDALASKLSRPRVNCNSSGAPECLPMDRKHQRFGTRVVALPSKKQPGVPRFPPPEATEPGVPPLSQVMHPCPARPEQNPRLPGQSLDGNSSARKYTVQ